MPHFAAGWGRVSGGPARGGVLLLRGGWSEGHFTSRFAHGDTPLVHVGPLTFPGRH